MANHEDPTTKTPTEARGASKSGIVWKVLAVSVVLAIIAMVVIGQGTDTADNGPANETPNVAND